MPMDTHAIDRAEHRRDRRLRRRVLQVLGAARVRPEFGWATGRFVFDLVDGALPGGEAFGDDSHMLALARDLVSAGYVEERDDRRYEWQQPGLDTTSYRITHHGTALLAECIDPDPLIEHPRLSPARERRTGGR